MATKKTETIGMEPEAKTTAEAPAEAGKQAEGKEPMSGTDKAEEALKMAQETREMMGEFKSMLEAALKGSAGKTEGSGETAPDTAAAAAHDWESDLVEYTFPVGEKGGDLKIGINGKLYLIKRGYPVKVPRAVIQCFNDSERQRLSLFMKQDEYDVKNGRGKELDE